MAALLAIPLALVVLVLGLAAAYGLDRLDDPDVDRRPPSERFPHRSRTERLARWLVWALPSVTAGSVVGWQLWGDRGLVAGSAYAATNVFGTSMFLSWGGGPRARTATITGCIVQLPLGILFVLGEGL